MISNLDRQQKLALLKGVLNGTISKEVLRKKENIDMSVLTDDELRSLIEFPKIAYQRFRRDKGLNDNPYSNIEHWPANEDPMNYLSSEDRKELTRIYNKLLTSKKAK